jgi:HupE/UreJ protein
MRTVLWASLVLMLHTPPSFAHPLMVGYADIAITDREVEVRLSVNLSELDQLMSLDANRNGEVEGEELAAKAIQISDYLRKKVQVRVGDAILPMEAEPFRIRRSLDGKPTLEATLRFRSVEALETFTILCEPLTELGADHRTLATITREGRVGLFLFQQGAVYQGYHGRPRGSWAYALQFIGLGIHHIFVGYDHIAFLLGLLLIGGRLLGIIKIVTSFTVAHSVTLSLAALNIVSLPPGLVEAGIALSVAYVALENLFFQSFDRRWMVSFFFGLVHGFGFANVLNEMHLSRSGLAASLFFFNFGVEIGQLVIVMLFVPLLWLLARTRAYHVTTKLASVVILALGAFWFVQRAL